MMSFSKPQRRFVAPGFRLDSWDNLEPLFKALVELEINNSEEFRSWWKDRSELESVVSEDGAWRYIEMTRNTADEQRLEAFKFFISEIEPRLAPYSHLLNHKAIHTEGWDHLLTVPGYLNLKRNVEKEISIFREVNIPIKTEIQTESQKYSALTGAMTVEVEGEEKTLQQAGVFMMETDRNLRENVYYKINARRIKDQEELNNLFDRLIRLRHQVANNSGFENFRDYMFTAMGRFDYEPRDCFDFHQSVQETVVPILDELALERKQKLQLDQLKPWDKSVDPLGRKPLKPFKSAKDLLEKTITCFDRLDPFLGECLRTMQDMGYLDLESRKNKAPGGYNYPLDETGIPFIFMNATSTVRDMVTLLHEGGHAVHSFTIRDHELNDFKHPPSEVAELASMSMELLTIDHWDIYFDNEEDLNRAKKNHLEDIVETLPWVATIDKFQHWIYENPDHTVDQRNNTWKTILDDFSDTVTNWDGQEKFRSNLWQKQLHLYEVPFYYIEYGFAQLGAIAIWKNYKENPKKTLEQYLAALRLGYTKSIPEIYETAGIKFDFSKNYILELAEFLKKELEKLN